MIVPSILFVCRHNACRSQIAEAIGRSQAPVSWVVSSAGSHPAAQTDPKAGQILRLHGLGMANNKPKGFPELPSLAWDYVVDISCEKAGAAVRTENYIAWDLPDPLDGPMGLYERLFEDLTTRIRDLFHTIQETEAEP